MFPPRNWTAHPWIRRLLLQTASVTTLIFKDNFDPTFFLVKGWIHFRNYRSPMLFVIFNGLGAFVLDDRDIVIEMLGLGFIKGASLDGKLMAIREHTV